MHPDPVAAVIQGFEISLATLQPAVCGGQRSKRNEFESGEEGKIKPKTTHSTGNTDFDKL